MKVKRFLTGLLTAAMVITSVPMGIGSIAAKAGAIIVLPDVTVTAPSAGESLKDAVLTAGVVMSEDFSTENLRISEDGGISGKLTAADNSETSVFNVKGTTKFLLHFQMKSGRVDHIESIIGKMNSQYGIQIASMDASGNTMPTSVVFYSRIDNDDPEKQWMQVSYRIPNNAWYNEWHDVVAYYDGNGLHMYVDGNAAADDREDVKGSLLESADSLFTIGYNHNPLPANTADPEGNKQQYFGEVKDIALYVGDDNVPTDVTGNNSTEIKAAYASALAGKTSSFELKALTGETGCSVKSTSWEPDSDAFDPYADYKVTVVLEAKEGYSFKSADAILRTGTEVLDDAKVVLNGAKDEMTITYTFEGEEVPPEKTCGCILSDITGFDGDTFELYEGEERKVELGSGKFTWSSDDCEKHPGSKPQTAYELAGSPAGASLEGNTLKLTADASKVQVRFKVTLGEQTKTATATYTVIKKDSSEVRNTLISLIKEMGNLNADDYTAESWNVMKTVYDEAVKMDPATAAPAECIRVYNALTKAKAALVKASVTVVPGQICETTSGRYQVISAEKKTVRLVQANKKKEKAKMGVAASIKINGVTYKVTEVGPKAFKGFKKLKTITLTKNITTIGKQAFSGCKKLNSVVVKGTLLKKFGAGAFKGTSKKMTVSFKAKKVTAKKRAALLKKMKKAGLSKSAKLK